MLVYIGQLNQMRIATEASTKTAALAADALDYNTSQFERMMRQLRYQTKAQVDAANAGVTSSGAAKSAAQTAKAAFEVSNRPYVDIIGAAAAKFENGQGLSKLTELHFEAQFKELGPVPALNFTADWKIFLDGVEQGGREGTIPAKPSTLYPGAPPVSLNGWLHGVDAQKVFSGKSSLELEVTISFSGSDPNQKYKECEKMRYDAPAIGFFDLGPTCSH